MNFKKEVALGIPKELPNKKIYDPNVNHAPIRENVLTREEKILALRNALRYFDKKFHEELIPEFKSELEKFGISKADIKPYLPIKNEIIEDFPLTVLDLPYYLNYNPHYKFNY